MHPPLDAPRLRAALDALALRDADLAGALVRVGYPAPRTRPAGFATLLRIIVAQQLSTRAAAAIWARLEAATAGPPTPDRFLALSDEALRAVGFSLRKVEHGRALAQGVVEGALDLEAWHATPDEAVITTIAGLKGFGRWSADIYLLFSLGRADVFPADDLALQVAYARLKRLPERPKAKALRALTESWSPWRGAAAVFLWHYYGAATLDEVPPPQ
jgi:DNA-3-methyladenine glycosylase II